jgi:hypothetical protein
MLRFWQFDLRLCSISPWSSMESVWPLVLLMMADFTSLVRCPKAIGLSAAHSRRCGRAFTALTGSFEELNVGGDSSPQTGFYSIIFEGRRFPPPDPSKRSRG